MMMEYTFSHEKFNLNEFLNVVSKDQDRAICLFGAAGWGEALLDELIKRGFKAPIFFADNDVTKQDKTLRNISVLSPEILSPEQHRVVITTISAGDAVSKQLERMGFVRDVTYFEVMHNKTAVYPVDVLSFYLGFGIDAHSKTILQVGPGGHLGIETILAAMGARRIVSIDYNSYGIQYPDVTRDDSFYREMSKLSVERFGVDPFASGVLKTISGKTIINKEKLEFFYPCSVTSMPFPDDTFDYVLHHAVFEHVAEPAKGYREIARVLKPGGRTVGLVDPQDHRQFSSFEDYHPLKFLEYTQEEWKNITRKINYHNQFPTPFHKRFIIESGLEIDEFCVLESMKIPETLLDTFSSEFQNCDPELLGVLRFSFSALKL